MLHSKFNTLLIFFIAFTMIFAIGCSSDEEESSRTNSQILEESVIDLPSSLTGSSSKGITRDDGSDGIIGMYTGVQHYVKFAEMMKDAIKDMMTSIVSNPDLFNDNLIGVEIDIPDDPNDPDAPTKLLIEKPTGEDYEWKFSLYFSDSSTPALIIRFSIIGDKAKGRFMWDINETVDVVNAPYNINTSYTKQFKMDVVFDATGDEKWMEIKVVQDLSDLVAKAKTACTAYSGNEDARKAITGEQIFDIGQPAKLKLYASSDDTIVTLYATSYHSTWKEYDSDEINLDPPLFSEARCIYTFRAKGFDESNSSQGALIDLALPLETASSVDWVADAFNTLLITYVNENFVGSPWDTEPWLTLKNAYISYFNMMNNSAYFSEDDLLGFYNGTTFYKYTGNTIGYPIEESSDLSSIQYLLDFDLSTITVYPPDEVVAMDITLQK